MIRLFLWATESRSDGDLTGLTSEDIELAIDWIGENDAFVHTLVEVGFLDGDEGRYQIHDWAEHNPWVNGAEQRSARARWNAVKRHHGAREADRQVPEYALVRNANSNENDADSTNEDADCKLISAVGIDGRGTRQRKATRLKDASSTGNDADSNAPSPSPSPSPSPKATQARTDFPVTPPPTGAPPTDAGRACLLLRQAGCARVNPSNPDLLAAIAEGVTPEAIRDTYGEKPDATNPFAWAITTARSRHAEGPKQISTGPPNGRQPSDSKTLTGLKKLQGLKTDETLPTRVASERDSGRLIEAGDAEP
ncbi:hypothetical protein [Rhodanobacter glycinis]|uniref:hypothetical protein n=1 Tax=Rhodanobacter glycinis TaxID=582702 RepID=UPI00112AC40F|nr:hypothetical protein [Rhodanobacter glycinis]